MNDIGITLNGEPQRVTAHSTLAELIAARGHAPQDLSTAVNGEFVARQARARQVLREGDAVFTFQPITGG